HGQEDPRRLRPQSDRAYPRPRPRLAKCPRRDRDHPVLACQGTPHGACQSGTIRVLVRCYAASCMHTAAATDLISTIQRRGRLSPEALQNIALWLEDPGLSEFRPEIQ